MKNFCIQPEDKDFVVFSVLNQIFLYSANTLSYFPITDCAKDILIKGINIEEKYSEKEISLTKEKLKEFSKNGLLSKHKAHEKGEIYYSDYYLKLVLSTRCNLHCSYCFARKSSEFDMNLETAKKAILYFINKFVPDKKRRIIVDLSGSGEPLLRLDLILKINEFVLTLKNNLKINIFCQFATNGMLLTNEISSILKKNGILFGVSLDGKKEFCEKSRMGLNYEVVSKNIKNIENKDFFGLAATYSAQNHDFLQIFKSLYSFTPEVIGMKPVRLNAKNCNSVNKDSIEVIKKSYDIFIKWLYKQLCFGNKKYFYTFYKSEDFLAKFLKTTLHPVRIFYRCSAAVNSFAVDSKENILICPAFIENREAILGNLDKGLFEEKKKIFENFYADKIIYCKKCWARYACGGECFAVGYENHKIFEKPEKSTCELKKYLIQLSVWFWTNLKFEHPEIYKTFFYD